MAWFAPANQRPSFGTRKQAGRRLAACVPSHDHPTRRCSVPWQAVRLRGVAATRCILHAARATVVDTTILWPPGWGLTGKGTERRLLCVLTGRCYTAFVGVHCTQDVNAFHQGLTKSNDSSLSNYTAGP